MAQCCKFLGESNTGLPATQRILKSGSKLIYVPFIANDGTINKILSTDTVDQAYLDAKISEEDPTKRWYPLPVLQNVLNERADPSTESFDDGSNDILIQGVRTFSAIIKAVSNAYKSKLESLINCQRGGFFVVDACGDIYGELEEDSSGLVFHQNLLPISINQNSFEARVVTAGNTASGKIQLNFEFDQLVSDGNLRYLSGDSVTADFLRAEGLIDVDITAPSVSTTLAIIAVTQNFDGFNELTGIEGLVIADFIVNNKTTGLSVALTTVTDLGNGGYSLLYPAQSASDELEIKVLNSRFTGSQEVTIS